MLHSPAGSAPNSIFKQAHNDNVTYGCSQAAAGHAHTSRLACSSHSVEGSPASFSQPVRQAFNQMVHSLGKGLSAISVSGSGGTGAVLRFGSSGGQASPGASITPVGARLPPGLIITSSNGDNSRL